MTVIFGQRISSTDRVVDDDRDTFRGIRQIAPRKRRRNVLAITGVSLWNRLAVGKARTCNGNRAYARSTEWCSTGNQEAQHKQHCT